MRNSKDLSTFCCLHLAEMNVKNPTAAFLSNYEVLALMKEMKSSKSNSTQESTQLATVVYEVCTMQCLQNSPCKDQSPGKIDKLMTELKHFPIRLSKLEKLMICNNPPQTVLQLSLILNNRDEDVSESVYQNWIDKINDILS